MLDGTDLHSSCCQLLLNQQPTSDHLLFRSATINACSAACAVDCMHHARQTGSRQCYRGSSTIVRFTANIAGCGTGAPPDDKMLAPPPDDIMMGLDGGTPAAPPPEPAVDPSSGRSDGLQALADLGPLSTPGSIRLAVALKGV